MENLEVIKRQGELLSQVERLSKKRNISRLLSLEIGVYEMLDSIIDEIENR